MASISIDDVVVGEQDGFANFVIRLDAPASTPVTVNYRTDNSTAIASSDYVFGSGTLTFDPGETVKTVSVQVTNDAVPEGTEVRSSTTTHNRARRRSRSTTWWSTKRRGAARDRRVGAGEERSMVNRPH